MSKEKMDNDELDQSTPDLKRMNSPPDYEKVLSTRKDELRLEEFPNLLLFPQQDVIAKAEPWDYRTATCTVPDKALDQPTTLFTHECLRFYSSQWERVTYNFAKYGGSYALLLDEEAREALPHLTFERDQLEAEAFKEETDGTAKQLSKCGYLSRGPFPGDQSTSSSAITAKSYRKHWFDLRPSTQSHGGSYTFVYYGDDKSTSVKGKVPVETINEIKKNPKYKQYGFDLLTEDERTVYPLAADTERDMEEWIDILKKAFGLENEEQTGVPVKPVYSTDTLRDTAKRSLLRPELLQYSEGATDNENRANRQTERNDVFLLYPELLHQPPPEAEEGTGPVPKENFGIQVHVVCRNLFLKLSMTKSGISQLLEPFFIKLALYDAQKGIKISEDFHVDLNESNIRSLLPKRKKLVRVGLDYEEKDYDDDDEDSTPDDTDTIETLVNTIKEAVFSVVFPNPEIYLVGRIEKVLHGGIQQCAEPYQRTGDTAKVVDRISKQMGGVCGRLGAYKMPFAWTARPVFGSNGIDQTSEFSLLYRQDKERITDDDLLKYLADFKNLGRYKLPVIAGNLIVTIQQFNGRSGMILTPSLLPLKSTTQQSSTATMIPTIKEIRPFTPFRLYEPHTHYDPYLSLTHNLYVYPLLLNYETQKNFPKARNIAIKIEFKESDYSSTAPLKVIYSRSVGEAFSTKAVSHVLYHSQTPTFYEEVKIKLPIRLSRRHHVLITFLHVSCELPKSSKSTKGSTRQPPPVESVVGYTWIPLLETDGKIISNIQSLPVATTLPPGYLSTLRGDLKKQDLPTPNVQWVDSAKLIFKVRLKLDSTIYTEDAELFTFFAVSDHVQRGKSVPLDDLRFAIESLHDCDLLSLFHAPVLFHMLLRLLCFSQEPVPLVKLEIMNVLVSFINKLVSVERQDILKSYIEYMFVTEVDPISGQAIHDELVALLIEYLDQNSKNKESMKFLNFVSFFLDIILKSMAQFLGQIGKENAGRKSRYPDEFGNNLCALIEKLIPRIIMCHIHPTGPRANVGVATFLKHSFSFMDRGVIFKIIQKCLDEFDEQSKEEIILMKLDFISILCEHEHFIPLNLPFKQKTVDVLYELDDEYCSKHFLASILLKEVERSLASSSSTVRQKGVCILRNLLAKLDSDERFSTPVQKGRIATLFFPIISMTIQNFHRLKQTSSQSTKESSKMEPLHLEPQSPSPSNYDEDNTILSSSGGAAGGRTGAKRSLINDFNTASVNPPKSPAGSDVESSVTTPTPGKMKHSVTGLSTHSTSKLKDYSSDTLDVASVREEIDEKEDDGEGLVIMASSFGIEETRDLLICFLFVLNHIEQRVIEHWWVLCVDRVVSTANSRVYSWSTDVNPISNIGTEIEIFFDLLKLCVCVFEYSGRRSITKKWSARTTMLKQLEQSYTSSNLKSKGGGGGGGASRRSFAAGLSSSKSRLSRISSSSSFISPAQLQSPLGLGSDDMELYIRTEGNLANEVGLIVLQILEEFMDRFKALLQDSVDNQINGKIVCVLSTLLEVHQSTILLKHVFASLRSYVHKFSSVLFRGSPEYCGSICYQLLLSCNSLITSTKAEASALLYLLMRCNYEYFNKQQGFVRTDLQMTKSLSKIATMDLPRSYSNLRRSLGVIVMYADNDSRVQSGSFPSEIRDLMIRLRTVLSSTTQMKEHRSDPERLLDLQYSLARSYAHSPELRHTWLESMALLHIEHKNYTEAAQCYLHIAGLVAEYMKVTGKYSNGSKLLRHLSYNVEKEESGMKLEKGASREQRYSEVDLVTFLESSMSLLEQSELYELTTHVFQLLLPYYQEQKNFKKLTDMYGHLHDCHKKILSTMESGKRYLGTYFRIAFYGALFGEDHKKQFIYREPKVTGLAEITQRLVKLYSRKFGPETVQVLQEAGKIDSDSLDKDKAYIQITHVQPYFTEEELQERTTKFEREHSLSKFMFEVPFTPSGEARGDVENQHMRKTLLITSHWFPYIVKRIPVVRDESWEITPVEVAVEAMSKKRDDLLMEVSKKKHDLVNLQLLLQGSLSPQVNQGALEYANVFLKTPTKLPHKSTDQLKEVYSSFMQLCKVALAVHGQLIGESQLLLHEDMLQKFQHMSQRLEKLFAAARSQKQLNPSQSFQFSSRISSPSKRQLIKSATTIHPTL